MRILTRYILWEVTLVFLATLVSMTAFVFLALIGKEAVEKGLGLAPIVRMLPYILPEAMQFAVPGSLLLATTSVYGRIASSNEIVAIKSLGISPMNLVWPTILLACLMSLGAVALNDIAMSWGRSGRDRVFVESLEEIAYGRLRTMRSFSTSRLHVNVKRVEGRRLVGVFIQFSGTDGDRSLITADAAELYADSALGAVTIKLYNAEGALGGWSIVHPGEFERSFAIEEFMGNDLSERTPSTYALREIGPSKAENEKLLRILRQEMAADVGAALLLGRFDDLSESVWLGRQSAVTWTERMLDRLAAEPYRRWANGFSCLAFALLGAPVAVLLRRGEVWSTFFVCFLPILLLYYPMLVVCTEQAKEGGLPPAALWLGDVVLALAGIKLLRTMIRFDHLDWRRLLPVRAPARAVRVSA